MADLFRSLQTKMAERITKGLTSLKGRVIGAKKAVQKEIEGREERKRKREDLRVRLHDLSDSLMVAHLQIKLHSLGVLACKIDEVGVKSSTILHYLSASDLVDLIPSDLSSASGSPMETVIPPEMVASAKAGEAWRRYTTHLLGQVRIVAEELGRTE